MRRRRLVSLLMLLLYLPGCRTWEPVAATPRQLIEEERPGLIRIVHTNGTERVLQSPQVERDSITATVRARGLPTGSDRTFLPDTVRIALADVAAVETQTFSAGRTALVVLLIPVGAMAATIGMCFLSLADCN